jgi:MFS family permease
MRIEDARALSPSGVRITGAIAALTAMMAAGAAMRLVFSPVQDLAKAQLHLTDVQLGLVQGLAASLPVAALSLPLGRVTDRSNRVRLLAMLTLLSVAGTVLTALAPGFATLFAARMLAGVGGTCALPVAISIVADLAVPERRGRALLFIQVGQMVGAAAAFALGGGLLVVMAGLLPIAPWRGVHIAFAVFALAAVVPLAFVREPVRGELEEGASTPLRAAFAELWRRRALIVPLYLGQLTVVMADSAAGIWAAPVLDRDFHTPPAQFATWMGLLLLGSGIFGAVLGGLSADAGSRGRLPGGMLFGAAVAAAVSIPAALFPIAPDVATFGFALGVLLICGSVTSTVTATVIAVHVPNEVRGLCLGLFIVIGALGGLGVAPTLVPLIGAAFAGGRIAPALAAVTAGTSMIALVGFLVAARRTARPAC